MGNLLTSLLHTADALRVFDRQIAVVQNNVTNASTPGYVKQIQTVDALPFDLDTGLSGGIAAGGVVSARSDYAEQGVRRQQALFGEAQQMTTDLSHVESLFDLASPYGVAGSMNKFFQSFSQLSVNPNDQVARQSVIDRARELAVSFNHAAEGLTSAGNDADRQVRSTIDSINRLAAQIRDLNEVRRQNFRSNNDAGVDAQMHALLEELAEQASFTVLEQSDGTVTLFLGGQSPLVIGDHLYPIQGDFSTPVTRVLDATGEDISAQVASGRLAALLREKNEILPSYLEDLNKLAGAFANEVNLKLAGGVDSSGGAPVLDLFSYNATVGEAISMSVTSIAPVEVAAAYPWAPGGNGNALDIAGLVDARLVDGFTFAQYFGNIGGRVGRDLATARERQESQSSLLAQSRNLRDQISGVDINEEAAHLIQIQRAYQATGKLMTVINELTDTLLGMIR